MTAERPIKVETIENTCGTSENKTSWILAALFGFHMSGCQNLTWLMVIARYTGLPQTLIDPNVGTPTRQKMERLRGTTKKDSDFTNFHLSSEVAILQIIFTHRIWYSFGGQFVRVLRFPGTVKEVACCHRFTTRDEGDDGIRVGVVQKWLYTSRILIQLIVTHGKIDARWT